MYKIKNVRWYKDKNTRTYFLLSSFIWVFQKENCMLNLTEPLGMNQRDLPLFPGSNHWTNDIVISLTLISSAPVVQKV